MKERPIILNAREVSAVVDGRKTVLRRVVKPQPEEGTDCPYHIGVGDERKARRCPYGQPGDRLWVREKLTHNAGGDLVYASKGTVVLNSIRWPYLSTDLNHWSCPSIYMPRWASRITLEITGVRMERVQDISIDDAIAEGETCRSGFEDLWDSLNAKRGFGWDKNPWVWVIQFKVVRGEK